MTNIVSLSNFANSANGFAKNPLGIIGLFLVLVYGLATLVVTAGSLSPQERTPLIYFLVVFPVLVLGVFAWLVVSHSTKLFSPADFRDEDNYVKMNAVASLTAATVKNSSASEQDLADIVRTVDAAARASHNQVGWKHCVLWVDDRPDNNFHERRAFEAIGLEFTLSESTAQALTLLSRRKFAAIISDMGRREGPREGYVLLDAIRSNGNQTPLFFYASSNNPDHVRETFEHGGQGCTNDPEELFTMVTKALVRAS